MPTVSKKQEKFMQAVAHNPAFAKKAGVPQSVGKEFTKSGGGMKKDSTKKMAMGGMGQRPMPMPKRRGTGPNDAGPRNPGPMPKPRTPLPQSLNKPAGMKNGGMAASKMGAVKTAAPSRDGVAVKGKTKGKQIVMAGNKGMKKGGAC